MPDIPGYVSQERNVSVTVEKPDGSTEVYKSSFDYVIFIDVRDEGVWIRNETGQNIFYPSGQILKIVMGNSGEKVPDSLQKQRR